ncbi:MAG: prepilin-type N-terminal cleavage/methylation domain-containing protein [Rubrivivax sp.]
MTAATQLRGRRRKPDDRGFTLVEVLVALFVMAILATLAWQGLDGIVRARDGGGAAIERSARLATVMTQWEQDLQAVFDTGAVPAIAFDGQTLRLTRRTEGGVQVVAWAVRGGLWQRWAGPACVRAAELGEGWLRSQQLLGTEPGHLTVADGASTWQVYFNFDGSWSNAQSTANLATPNATGLGNGGTLPGQPQRLALPGGVRMVITLNDQTLTRDVALGPGE